MTYRLDPDAVQRRAITTGKTLTVELLSVGSRLVNVLTGGQARTTFSSRSYQDSLWTVRVIDWIFWTLSREKDHCRAWYEDEVRQAKATVAAALAKEGQI